MSDTLFESFKIIEKTKITCFMGLSLSPPRAIILMLCKMNLEENKSPFKPSQISEKLEVKPAAITPILNKLEAEGYIKREVSLQDRREVLVNLTEQGIAECRSIEEHMKEYFDRLRACVGQPTLDEFVELCKKFEKFNNTEAKRRLIFKDKNESTSEHILS